MNQKQMFFWLLLFLFLSTVASAQQATKADVQALELKLINTITEMDKRLTNQIVELDKRLTSQIADLDKRVTGLQTTVTEMDKRLTNQIGELDKRLSSRIDTLFWAIGALIAVVLAVIALPQILGYFQEKRARVDFQKRIEELEQRLEQHQREIEALKSRRVMTPS